MIRKVWDPRVWPSRLVARYVVLAFVLAFLIANYALWHDTKAWDASSLGQSLTFGGSKHPIKKLMMEAREAHEAQLETRSWDVDAAASRYRARRGRHPPPGFDKWVEAALEADAVIVEDYFDRIYKDLTPYWALDPGVLTTRANAWYHVVKVRNGTAHGAGDVTGRVPWLKLWTDLVKEFAEHLPDVDMPINYMDEPRLLVPYDQIDAFVAKEQAERSMPDADDVTDTMRPLTAVDDAKHEPYDPEWAGPDDSNYWDLAVKTCGPHTPAFEVSQISTFADALELPHDWAPEYSYRGFVKNWTASMDPCSQPHMRQLHGSFIEPFSISSTEELIPMFGGSKLPMNNEILIPGAMYLSDDTFYSGGDSHGPSWNRKENGLVWRGDATGGRVKPETWHHFQRHRLMDMLNITTLTNMQPGATGSDPDRQPTFELPSKSIYPRLALKKPADLAHWLEGFADVGFVHLCTPGECDFLYNFYKELPSKKMKEQYKYKFLPDADGNSFSARFRGFMRSTSLPLKATIYAEWHDDRLTPWLHFVPLDNTYQDLYPALEYLADREGQGDDAARFIAERGQKWAEMVLRSEDMQLYTWRLLLEWARICSEERHTLGYVEDLRGEKTM